MEKRKTYTVSGLILILLGVIIASYPVIGYCASTYINSPHAVLKPGSNFVYAGYFLTGDFNLLLVYNVTYVENNKFQVKFDLYNVTDQNHVTIIYFTSLNNPGKITGNPQHISEKTVNLSVNDPLIKTLFPESNITIHVLNYSKTSKLTIRKIPFSFDFSPYSLGFPYIYAPDLPEPLAKYGDEIAYYRTEDRYFARTLRVVGSNVSLQYHSIVDGMPTHVPIGVTPEQLDLQKLIPAEIVSNTTWRYIESSYPTIMILGLLRTNVQPTHQNWLGGLEYSFTQYSAPVDYVLILMGIVLLILGGRAGQ
ncbi:hypothetical protein [Thermococcus sp.]|uniref:hypothetical protein n=1 Tax=Thermococcus sp. TaxID=35749 RepID=UPI00262D23E0|nr:hypothetical protein [Thermococcus sp.]